MMAKRFTDTAKWNEDWFLELTNLHKLFWIYICDNCNHAGIFKPNKRVFELLIGERIDTEEFLKVVNDDKQRIILLGNGRWYLTGFIPFQYGGNLNEKNRVHKSILEQLNNNGIEWVQEDTNLPAPKQTKEPVKKVDYNTPRSITEAQDYFIEKGSTRKEGEAFYYFYESKNWMVGKNKMKNWKMAASGWISRNKKDKPDSGYLSGQLKDMRG